MKEDIQAQASEATAAAAESGKEKLALQKSAAGFPEEAFACPHCGQMLGPAVRVCAACRQAIDPSQIRVAAAAPAAAPARPVAVPRARFSWGIFLAALLAWLALATSMIRIVGFEKAQYMMAGILVLSAAWVFLDARQKGFPRPFQWGAGALLFWIVFFPWYLARRRQPEASCPIVEAGTGPFLRVLLLILAFALGVMLLLSAIATRLPNLPK
ncbi:MAG TPA: hypothetical protein VMT20_27210 [Terriglobia bacterium]|nr:hypothetical protein [Terriglobia bacterium]